VKIYAYGPCDTVFTTRYFNVINASVLAEYAGIRYNGGLYGTPFKAMLNTPTITTPMPTGTPLTTYRTNLDAAIGWMGPGNTLGIADINTNGSYEVRVYQVDGSGNRYKDPTTGALAPDLSYYYNPSVADTDGRFPFNDQTVSFDPGNPPFYASGTATDDAEYFKNFHNWAFDQGATAQAAFSSRTYCVAVTVTTPPPSNCSVTNKKFFKIAINPSLLKSQSGVARHAGDNDEDKLAAEQVGIYPNPTDGALHITIPFAWQQANIEIVNNLGQTILHAALLPKQLNLNIQSLSSGIYFYHLTVDGARYTGKLMKTK
jgi:hypothetical protein